jgi:hypothetical protein
MRLDLRDLRVKASKLELRVKALTQSSHGATNEKDNLVTPASTQEDLIGLYARKFGTMNEFYVPCAAFMVARPTGVRSDDPDRWDSEKLALRGLIAELYEELPVVLHELLAGHSSFRTMVSTGIKLIDIHFS